MLENSTAVSVAALLPLFHDLELSGLFRKFCDRPAVSLFNHMPYAGQGNDPFLKGGGGGHTRRSKSIFPTTWSTHIESDKLQRRH